MDLSQDAAEVSQSRPRAKILNLSVLGCNPKLQVLLDSSVAILSSEPLMLLKGRLDQVVLPPADV